MADNDNVWDQWSKAGTRNVAVFALSWFGMGFLVLWFVKLGSGFWYFFAIVWTTLGLLLVVRPAWFIRTMRASEKDWDRVGENLEKHLRQDFLKH